MTLTLVFQTIAFPAFSQGKAGVGLKTRAPIPVGVAIGYMPMMHHGVYQKIVASEFDHVTFEYALKNGAIVRGNGSFDYSRADELLKNCQRHGLRVYGHTLCWYQNNSPYLSTLKGDSAAVENFLKKYIVTTVSRYKGEIYAWDVVNEAIDQDGHLRISGVQKKDYFYWGSYLRGGTSRARSPMRMRPIRTPCFFTMIMILKPTP